MDLKHSPLASERFVGSHRCFACRSVTKHSAPTAADAPTRSEPRHPPREPPRLHPKCHRIAVRTPIAFREYPIKHERGRHNSQHKDRYENGRENRCIRHVAPPYCAPVSAYDRLESLLDLHPRLDIGHAVFNSVDDYLGPSSDSRAVETLCRTRVPPTTHEVGNFAF